MSLNIFTRLMIADKVVNNIWDSQKDVLLVYFNKIKIFIIVKMGSIYFL